MKRVLRVAFALLLLSATLFPAGLGQASPLPGSTLQPAAATGPSVAAPPPAAGATQAESAVPNYAPTAPIRAPEAPHYAVPSDGRVHLTGTFSVAVSDTSGDPDDQLIKADGNTYQVTVTVTDGGAPVAGAQLYRFDTLIGSTDSSGKITVPVSHANPAVDWYRVEASGSRSYGFELVFTRPGEGAISVSALDTAGMPFLRYHTYLGDPNNAQNIRCDWPVDQQETSAAICPEGTFPLLIVAKDANGVGYSLPMGTVTVTDQGRTAVTADARSMGVQTVTVHLQNGDTSVAGANLFAQRAPAMFNYWDPVITSDASGNATFKIGGNTTGPWVVGMSGGAPKVLGIATGLTGNSATFDFAGTPTLTVTAVDSTGQPAQRVDLQSMLQGYGMRTYGGGAGSYLVWPGSLTLFGWEYMNQGDWEYQYQFRPLDLADSPYDPIEFAKGDPLRTFAMGGPVQPLIEGPNGYGPGPTPQYWAKLAADHSWIDWITRSAANQPWERVLPGMAIKDKDGNVVVTNDWDWGIWQVPQTPGAYKVSADFPDIGPYQSGFLSVTRDIRVFGDVTLEIKDDAGDQYDRVIPADSNPHTITVTVKDSTAGIGGAKINLGGNTLATTDQSGVASFALTAGGNRNYWLEVEVVPGWRQSFDVAALEPGSAIVDLYATAPNGDPIRRFAVSGYRTPYDPNWAWEEWNADAWGNGGSWIVPAGTFRVQFLGRDESGQGYFLELGDRFFADGARCGLPLDMRGMSLRPIYVGAAMGETPVAGADVVISNTINPVRPRSGGISTDGQGQAVIYANGDADTRYAVSFGGGSPAVAGTLWDLPAGPTDRITLDFAGSPSIEVTAKDAAGNSIADRVLELTSEQNQLMSIPNAQTVHVQPGDYVIDMWAAITVNGARWNYQFVQRNPDGRTWNLVHFGPEDPVRHFDAGGPLSVKMAGPDKLYPGDRNSRYGMAFTSDSSQLTWIDLRDDVNHKYGGVVPTMTARDSDDQVVAQGNRDWFWQWSPNTEGSFTVSGSLDNAGPYFAEGSHFADSMQVTAQNQYSFSTDRPWIDQDDHGPINVWVIRNGQGMPHARLELPKGVYANGQPTNSLFTDGDGRASFSLRMEHGGGYWVNVYDGDRKAGGFNLLVTDDRFGVIRTDLTDGPWRLSPWTTLVLAPKSDGTYQWDELSGTVRGIYPDFRLAPAGTYAVVMNGPDFYVAKQGVTVNAHQVTTVPVELSTLPTIDYNVSFATTEPPTPAQWVNFTADGLGVPAHLGFWLTDGTGSMRVLPGIYGLAFGYTVPGSNGNIDYVAMASGVGSNSSFSQVYAADQFGYVEPVVKDAAGNATGLRIDFDYGDAGQSVLGDAGYRVYLKPGSYRLESFHAIMLHNGDAWDLQFSGRPAGGVVAGSNLTVWKNLGGPLTLNFTSDAPETVPSGGVVTFDFNLSTAAGDRLLRVQQNGNNRRVHLAFQDSNGNVRQQTDVTPQGPTRVQLDPNLPGGNYTVIASLDVGPYNSEPYTASLTLNVAGPAQYGFTVNPPWVQANAGTPITIHVTRNDEPLSGATIYLPPGSTGYGIGRDAVQTDANGNATFELHLRQGGPVPVEIWKDNLLIQTLTLLTTDGKWGIIHLSLQDENGFLPFNSLKVLPYRSDIEAYDRSTGIFGVDHNYVLAAVGQYAMTAAGSDYFWSQTSVAVNGNSATEVTGNLTDADRLEYQATLTDGTNGTPAYGGAITDPAVGAMGRQNFYANQSGSGVIRVQPGAYGLSFYFQNNSGFYVAALPGHSSSVPINQTFQTSTFRLVNPTAISGTGSTALAVVYGQGGDAPFGIQMDPGDLGFYLLPGDYTLSQYDALMYGPGNTQYRYWFTGRSSVKVSATEDNSSIWADLGGPLAATLTGPEPGTVQDWNSVVNFDFELTTARGDRLLGMSEDGRERPARLEFLGADGQVYFSINFPVGKASPVRLPDKLPAGTYTVRATLGMGPYNDQPYVAEMSMQVEGAIWLKAVPANPGPAVQPGGLFFVIPDVTWVPGAHAYNLGIAFDPAKVAYVPNAGVTVDTRVPGVVRISGTADGSGGPPIAPTLAFQAVNGFSGDITMSYTADSAVSDGDGQPIQAGLQTAQVRVAPSAIRLTAEIDAPQFQQPRAVIVTNGIPDGQPGAFNQEAWRGGGDDFASQNDFAVLDQPAGQYTLVAMEQGTLQVETQVSTGSAGVTTPPPLTVRYGDFNADNQIDTADLQLMLRRYAHSLDSDSVAALYDPNDDGTVDLSDLYYVARNSGHDASVDMSIRGTLAVTIQDNTTHPEPVEGIVVVRRQRADQQWETVSVGVTDLSSGSNTFAVGGLPLGNYLVGVLLESPNGWKQSESAVGTVDPEGTCPLTVHIN